MYADDTIAAIATPPGQGGVGIVRVSGPLCVQIAHAVFASSRHPEAWVSHHFYHGRIVDAAGDVLDDALAVLMRKPRSYTGEDVLELHCHGGPLVLRGVLALVLSGGARLAERGEFTKRAFLNGRMDLTQAEAVMEMVRARTHAGAALAARQLSGQLSEELADLRGQLVHLKALLESQIDFPEEDLDITPQEILTALEGCATRIDRLEATYRQGKLVRDGLRIAIIGKPNVGKSSLLNALLGEERAIVTPIAGTTRDSIDETADFDGIPVVLSDTAGLREQEQTDAVERLGMARTVAKIADADVLLTVLDASAPLDEADQAVLAAAAAVPQVVVLNKIDLDARVSRAEVRAKANGHPVAEVSATQRLGLDQLRRLVVGMTTAGAGISSGGPILTSLRHHDVMKKAAASLSLARQSIADGRAADLVAVDVQGALDHIGEVTGAITSEEVLDRIFSEFCIGK